MAQHFLNASQVCPTVEHLGGKRVAHGMRRGHSRKPSLGEQLLKARSQRTLRHACAARIDEKCPLRVGDLLGCQATFVIYKQHGSGVSKVDVERMKRSRI